MDAATLSRTLCPLILFLNIGIIVAQSATFDPELMCTLVVNGTKMNDPRSCNAWIQCIDDRPISGTCPDALFYDRETEGCVSSDNITCISTDPCAALPNGFAVDPYSCEGYYYCKDGIGSHGVCTNNWNFNANSTTCESTFPCMPEMNPDSICNILPDGVFIKDTDNCNGYQLCWQGEVINGTCADSYYYSASQGACVSPQNVECAYTEAPIQTATPDMCAKANTFISDQSTCNGYYYCLESSSGQLVVEHGSCANGTFFSAANGGACMPRTSVFCAYDRCVDLGNTNIQLASVSDDGCTGFSICQDGITIGQASCPTGEYFDEPTQRCTTQLISYVACALSTESTTEKLIDGESTSTTVT